MRKPKNTLISALKPLTPVSVINMETGEVLKSVDYELSVRGLVNYVTRRTGELFVEHECRLLSDLVDYSGSANSYGRSKGYRIDYSTLPDFVLAKSRIQELVLHKLISTVSGYVNNPTVGKNKPSFMQEINLGAVNAQMAKLTTNDKNTLFLEWKCWDKILLLEFKIPDYILKRSIRKISLPTVQITRAGKIQYYFSILENTPQRKGSLQAGIDVGVVDSYSLSVITSGGKLVAQHKPSNRIKHLTKKVALLRREKSNIYKKMKRRESYGLDNVVLLIEYSRITRKITVLSKEIANQSGNEVAKHLNRYPVHVLALENLNWISGHKNSKIGHNRTFQHARLQSSIEHATQRTGVRTKKVNPKNTSQKCHKCNKQVKHDTNQRTVTCMGCSYSINRDLNASINIAKLVRTVSRGTGQVRETPRMVTSTKDSPRSYSTRIAT